MKLRLEGKVALITGGGTGIGAAIARRFVEDGAKICITGRRQELLEKEMAKLPEGSVVACAGDVSKLEDAQKMVRTAVSFGGKLDVLVNNAGIDPPGSVVDIDPALWRKIMDINVNGPFYLMKESIPYMIKAGGGSIINISSLAGIRCIPSMPAYCTSKAALIMLTQQAALDYGINRIRCNAICPGAVRTEMIEHAMTPLSQVLKTDMDGVFKYFSKNVPLHRVGKPTEISGICSFLASDDSTFMTGAVLVADGGAAIVDVSGAAVSDAGLGWG